MNSTPDQARSAVLQLPAPEGQGTKRNVPCQVADMRGKRLLLNTTERISESTLVSIEYEDTLFLGEVVVCTGRQENWTLEIRIEQVLTGLQSLMALRAHLLSESISAPLPVPAGVRD